MRPGQRYLPILMGAEATGIPRREDRRGDYGMLTSVGVGTGGFRARASPSLEQ